MRHRFAFLLIASCSSLILVGLAACSASSDGPAKLPLIEGGSKTKDSAQPPELDSSDPIPDASSGPGRVYAHTTDTLYLYEPVAGELTKIAKFSCLLAGEAVIDYAVDRTGTTFATTFKRFLSVDPITATCTEIGKSAVGDNYPNSLSFVPAGTVDATKEVLVGYAALGGHANSIDYVSIDTASGKMTKIGDMNPAGAAKRYHASGDIIALIRDGNRAYATVKLEADDAGTATGTDLLAEIDPKSGNVKRIIGDTKQNNIFGFGYWAGKGYAFCDNGVIASVDMSNGSSVVLKTLTVDGGPASWYGAGITTQAPTQ